MQALAVTEVNKRAEVVELPTPTVTDDTVLIRTLYSGVSVGTEMWIATGRRNDISTQLPYVTGYQVTGEIVEAGTNVEGFAVGDVVAAFCSSAHAQFVIGRPGMMHKLPDASKAKISSQFVMPCVGANGLTHASVNTGETVLVVGQGLIGQFTAQLARLRGAYVITSEVSPERLAISRDHCADWAIDASAGPLPDQLKTRFEWGVDVVLESTGFSQLLDGAMSCVRGGGLGPGGRFVFLGWYPDDVNFHFHTPHTANMQAFFPSFIGEAPNREAVLRLIASGKLEVEALISHDLRWQESGEAYSRLFTKDRDHFNGIVIDWTS